MSNAKPIPNNPDTNKKDFYEKLRRGIDELLEGNKEGVKEKVILSVIEAEANKNLSRYRQKKEDLIARMATDWPEWGCGLEFYSSFILPLLKNPLLMHFINKSDGISLQDYLIEYGYVDGDNSEIEYVEAKIITGDSIGQDFKPDLVDWAIYSLCNSQDPVLQNVDGTFVLRALDKQYTKITPRFVRIRAADIGVQAFLSLFEGIIRNAAKHRIRRLPNNDESRKNNQFKIKIIFFENQNQLKEMCPSCEIDGIRLGGDTCYVMISTSEDVIKSDKDNRERMINKDKIIHFLNKALSETIISDKGEIRPGSWGMKEMKICACFEAGRDLAKADASNPDYIKVIECPKRIWEDETGRFGYLLTLEKPRYILVLTNNNNTYKGIKASKWEKSGVKIVTLDEIKNCIYDYDILFVESTLSKHNDELDLIDKNPNLPFRKIKGHDENQENAGSNDAVINSFITEQYIKVIKNYMANSYKGSNFLVTIYFEDESLANKWGSWWKGDSEYNGFMKDWGNDLKCLFPIKAKEINSAISRCDIDNNVPLPMKISLLRHKNLSEIEQCKHRLNKDGDCLPKNILYHQHVSYADQFFSILMNTDPKTSPTLANIMFCQFLESALLNILVIDERISQILCRAVSPDEPGISLIDKLYWMGIYVASGFKNNGDTLFNYIPECTSQENKTFFKEIEFNNFTDGKKDSFKFEDELPIHILLIHATRFNEIYTKYCELQKGEFTKEKFIDDVLKKKFPHVVVHSGRGKTKGDIPGNVSFVEYSLVQKYLIQEPSKFFLTQIALNAKAGN